MPTVFCLGLAPPLCTPSPPKSSPGSSMFFSSRPCRPCSGPLGQTCRRSRTVVRTRWLRARPAACGQKLACVRNRTGWPGPAGAPPGCMDEVNGWMDQCISQWTGQGADGGITAPPNRWMNALLSLKHRTCAFFPPLIKAVGAPKSRANYSYMAFLCTCHAGKAPVNYTMSACSKRRPRRQS